MRDAISKDLIVAVRDYAALEKQVRLYQASDLSPLTRRLVDEAVDGKIDDEFVFSIDGERFGLVSDNPLVHLSLRGDTCNHSDSESDS